MHHGGDHHQAAHDSDCAFAPFAAAAALADVSRTVLTNVAPTAPAFRETAIAAFPTGPPALPPPATGPPALT
jgi:hypothetical protein